MKVIKFRTGSFRFMSRIVTITIGGRGGSGLTHHHIFEYFGSEHRIDGGTEFYIGNRHFSLHLIQRNRSRYSSILF